MVGAGNRPKIGDSSVSGPASLPGRGAHLPAPGACLHLEAGADRRVNAVGLAEQIAAACIEPVADVPVEVGGELEQEFAVGTADGQTIGERHGVAGVGNGPAGRIVKVEKDTRTPVLSDADIEDDFARRRVYEGD